MENNNAIQPVFNEPTLTVFIKAVTEKYEGDSPVAGVTFSYIDEKDQWYVAVNRFPSGHHERVCSAYGATLEDATRNCIRKWKRKIGITTEDNVAKLKDISI